MILLKANAELKTVFQKMINTMGENVKWTETFVINNNDIILAGKGRSLFFNFDNKRASNILVELPIEEDKAEKIIQDTLLENTLNMILYAFGKWGGIKGLKVEQNYDQLNKLINHIFAEIDIEASLTSDNFRFYKAGIQITYEEVIQAILDKAKPVIKKETEEELLETDIEESEESEESHEKENSEYEIGLWHKMQWTSGKFSFVQDEITESDKVKSRLGNNFYMVKYKCPACGEKLYMVVYPIGKEYRIETDGEAVYMARAYTCSTCNIFYTPKPDKLLMEGDIYQLNFQDDKEAYEDYLELLGKEGRRTSNCNLNKYESEYKKKNQETPPKLEDIIEELESLSEDELFGLKEKMDSGFYPQNSVDTYYDRVGKAIKNRKLHKGKNPKELSKSTKKSLQVEGSKEFKKTMEQDSMGLLSVDKSSSEEEQEHEDEHYKQEILNHIMKGEQDSFDKKVEKLTTKQRSSLKDFLQSEKSLKEEDKSHYIDKIDKGIKKERARELTQKVSLSQGKNYEDILQLIDEIERDDSSESVKKPILQSLLDLLDKRGKKELESIISSIPENITRKQYLQFAEKINQYKKIDNSPHKRVLDEKRDSVEKQEITSFIKRANAKTRRSLSDLYHKLKEQDFEERNVASYLEKIHDKIYTFDEEAIRKICPDPADITFEEGIKAYKEISAGNFLPELKVNMLSLIDKRLMKMKMDESEQLVKKLMKEMAPVIEEDSRIYFYEARKISKGDIDEEKLQIINNALNTYAAERGKYEYPLLICDASYFANGGIGFVLTPDHIFYNGLISLGVINVMDIESIFADSGLFSKGIYVNKTNKDKVKIANSLKSSKLKAFAKALNEFVNYLKEKPESRNISYMAKEKHTEKCCYRCGYFYKGGNVCPNCGSKYNE